METGRVRFPIKPLIYPLSLQAKENLPTPLVITFAIVPFDADPNREVALVNFSALATDGRGPVQELVLSVIKCRTRSVLRTMGTNFVKRKFGDQVLSYVQSGLRAYGLDLSWVHVKANETQTDAVEIRMCADEIETECRRNRNGCRRNRNGRRRNRNGCRRNRN